MCGDRTGREHTLGQRLPGTGRGKENLSLICISGIFLTRRYFPNLLSLTGSQRGPAFGLKGDGEPYSTSVNLGQSLGYSASPCHLSSVKMG